MEAIREIDHTICFTGHRKLNNAAKVERKLADLIERAISTGRDTFISGGAVGLDQMAAHIVLGWKQARLIIARPFPSQGEVWPRWIKDRFEAICRNAHEVVDVSPNPFSVEKLHKRSRWMIDHSSIVIAVYDGRRGGTQTSLEYARRAGKSICIVNPNNLTESWS